MSEKKKKTGLGRSAFFVTDEEQGEAAVTETPTQPQPSKKIKKVRTTVTLYPETLEAMELIRFEARKTGDKVTMSDVLREAVEELLKAKGLEQKLGS